MSLALEQIRSSFEVLKDPKKAPLYFDSACVSLKPNQVIHKINEYYLNHPSCSKRSIHGFADKTSVAVEESRVLAKNFIGAKNNSEVIFTKNTTEGINILANGLQWQEGDTVLITDLEHNSNLIPWMNLQQSKKIILKKISITPEDETFNITEYEHILKTNKVKLVSFFHISHITGMELPLKKMIDLAHQYGALFLLDAAQSIATTEVNVIKLDLDFLVFSFHKMFGPSGVGLLYGKKKHLENINPLVLGGQTVLDVFDDKFILEDLPNRLEAGLQDYAGIMGAGESIRFLQKIGQNRIKEHVQKLNHQFTNGISLMKNFKILGPSSATNRSAIINLSSEEINIKELSMMLDKSYKIMARNGVHCAHYWFNKYKLTPSLRFSFAVYNTESEVQTVLKTLNEISKFI